MSDKHDFDYDLFVIGAGSGGVRAARIAAGYGARVAIAEEYRYGGTCVIRGCVPKKLLVYASRFPEEFEDAAGFGWALEPAQFDWQQLIEAKDKEIQRLEGIYESGLKNAEVTRFESRAVLEDAHTIKLTGLDKTVTADKILTATGGKPFIDPALPGKELCISSNEIFHLQRLPQKMVVVGGGYIAVEFACLLNGLGVDVTLLYRGEEILRGFDADLRKALHAAMTAAGIDVVCGSQPCAVERRDEDLIVITNDKRELRCGEVLMATGRVPNTEEMGLEAVGVELGGHGQVVVDEYSKSSVDNIYAVGDATHRMNLTPVAIREGHAFADTVYGGDPKSVDHSLVPTAVFTTPEIGTVGWSEERACRERDAVDVYLSEFRPLKATLSGRQQKMLIKLIVDASDQKVLGAHLMGADSGELIQVLGVCMRMGATKKDFDATIAVHPTAAEEFVTMREPTRQHRR